MCGCTCFYSCSLFPFENLSIEMEMLLNDGEGRNDW